MEGMSLFDIPSEQDADVLCDVCAHDHECGYNDVECTACQYIIGLNFEVKR